MPECRTSFTDPTIVITDVLYRSIVIHAPDGSRYACTLLVAPDDVVTTAVASVQTATVDMRVVVTQVNTFPALVWTAFRGLPSGSYAYGIYTGPAPADGTCAVGALFNPSQYVTLPSPHPRSDDVTSHTQTHMA